jgi:hypothetical protein
MRAAVAEQAQQLAALLDQSQARFAAAGEEASGQLRQRVEETRGALAEQARELLAQVEESQAR